MLPTTTNRGRASRPLAPFRGSFGSSLLDDWMNSWFDAAVTGPSASWQGGSPTADFYETDDEFVLEMELAGYDRDDVEITVENGMLNIAGDRVVAEGDEDVRYLVRERTNARFSRSFSLPRSVDAEHVDARLDGGVLRVHLPKVAEARPRRIAVRAN